MDLRSAQVYHLIMVIHTYGLQPSLAVDSGRCVVNYAPYLSYALSLHLSSTLFIIVSVCLFFNSIIPFCV